MVTGASSGIGRAVALRLAGAGAHVFAAGRRPEALVDTVKAVAEVGGAASAAAAGLRDPGAVQGLVDRAMTETGRLDVMVNNAGVSFRGPLADGDRSAPARDDCGQADRDACRLVRHLRRDDPPLPARGRTARCQVPTVNRRPIQQ